MRTSMSPWALQAIPSFSRRALTRTSQPSAPWVCRQCQQHRIAYRYRAHNQDTRIRTSTQHPVSRSFSTTQRQLSQARKRAWREQWHRVPRERKRVAIVAAVAFVTFGAGLAFSEKVRHVYVGCERTGRVGIVLFLCIRDYLNILKREDWDDPAFQAELKEVHQRCANRTLHAMEKNGSIFIKLGQHLTSLNYLLPSEWCDTFIPLQDKCPVSSFSSINEMVHKDTGKYLEEYFSEFAAEPIGAASLAQVHIARLKGSEEKVAVKVQHPSLDEWAALDMEVTKFTFKTLRYWFPEYDLTWLSDEVEASLPKELDFREEGRNALRCKEYFNSHVKNTPLVVPEVYQADRRFLVMEYITGHRPDNLEYLDANGISRDEVAAALSRIFNEMIFGEGAPLHCDPHGGNLAIRINNKRPKPGNFDVVLYDHGLYRDIPQHIRRAYAHIWLAVLNTDIAEMRKYAYEIAGLTDDEFPIFASAITGRDYSVLTHDITQDRNEEEKRSMTEALGQDLVEKLVGMLGRVPRVILLILKTNDLTRSLEENLHTTTGPVRSFMILARYAARCVWEEEWESVRGSVFWPNNFVHLTVALYGYAKVALKLKAYEYYLSARRRLGIGEKCVNGLEAFQR